VPAFDRRILQDARCATLLPVTDGGMALPRDPRDHGVCVTVVVVLWTRLLPLR
jgi:hypothetical protein